MPLQLNSRQMRPTPLICCHGTGQAGHAAGAAAAVTSEAPKPSVATPAWANRKGADHLINLSLYFFFCSEIMPDHLQKYIHSQS